MTISRPLSQPDQTDGVRSFAGLTGHQYTVSPETALILLASRIRPDVEADRRLHRLLDEPPRWNLVVDLCQHHGVTGLIRRRLRDSGCWPHVPRAPRFLLDHGYERARAQHQAIDRELTALLAACALARIEPVVLKGAALASTAYPDPALRPMADVDLLVGPGEREATEEALAGLGYMRAPLYYSDTFNAAQGYHVLFVDPRRERAPVEVHWDLASRIERRNTLNAAALRESTKRIPRATEKRGSSPGMRVLTTEAHILYLATHVATEGHAFGRLIWLVDLAALTEKPGGVDWPSLLGLAQRWRVRTAVFVALALTRVLLGAAIPASVLNALRPSAPVLWALERMLNPSDILSPVDAQRRSLVKYVVVDRLATSVRLIYERLLPSPSTMRIYYPSRQASGLAGAYVRHVGAIGTAGARTVRTWVVRLARERKPRDIVPTDQHGALTARASRR